MSFFRRLVSFALVQMIIEVVAAVILVLILSLLLNQLPAAFLHSSIGDMLANVLYACPIVGVFLLASRWLEHLPLSKMGWPGGRRWGWQLMGGFLLGGCLMGAVISVMALAGFYRIVSIDLSTVWLFPVSLILFFAAAVQEELIFRGIIFRLLERSLGSWIAIILSALSFGAIHLANPGATLVSALALMLTAGVLLAAIYLLTRSLWWVIGLHFGWNFFEGPIFGAQISGLTTPALFHASISGSQAWTGGDFGPEAGLVALLIVGSIGLLLCVLAARRHYILVPRWLQSKSRHMQSGVAAGTDDL